MSDARDPYPHWIQRARTAARGAVVEDAITLHWTGEDAVRRRVVFEPRGTGGFRRIEQRFNGTEWVTEGKEIVARVGLDAPAATIVDGEVLDE